MFRQKTAQLTQNWSLEPLLGLGYGVALRADLLVKRDDRVVLQQRDQLLLVGGHRRVRHDLENRADEDSRLLPLQVLFVSPDHVEEGRDETRVRVKLDVGGEDEVGVGRLASNVPTDVDRVIELAEKRSQHCLQLPMSSFTIGGRGLTSGNYLVKIHRDLVIPVIWRHE